MEPLREVLAKQGLVATLYLTTLDENKVNLSTSKLLADLVILPPIVAAALIDLCNNPDAIFAIEATPS